MSAPDFLPITRLGTKAKNVIKNIDMKIRIIIAILLIFNYCTVFGQKNDEFPSYEKFNSSFAEHLKYPAELQKKCATTFTLMKVTFASSGEVEILSFSDSAEPEFVSLMQEIKDKLDFKSIYTDLKTKQKELKEVLIPIHIDFEKMDECKSTISSANLQKVYRFAGTPISGEYFMYPALYGRYVVGRTIE